MARGRLHFVAKVSFEQEVTFGDESRPAAPDPMLPPGLRARVAGMQRMPPVAAGI